MSVFLKIRYTNYGIMFTYSDQLIAIFSFELENESIKFCATPIHRVAASDSTALAQVNMAVSPSDCASEPSSKHPYVQRTMRNRTKCTVITRIIIWLKQWSFSLLLGECLVWISARAQSILRVLVLFFATFRQIPYRYIKLGHGCFLSYPSKVIIHCHPLNRRCNVWITNSAI
jgi:hypothetical protein